VFFVISNITERKGRDMYKGEKQRKKCTIVKMSTSEQKGLERMRRLQNTIED
jgi:hypothetical protein